MSQDRRTVFFQEISSKTTERSMRDYLRGYQISFCSVQNNDNGFHRGFAKVVFANEDEVNRFMSERPHKIDETRVFVHRKVVTGQSLREGYKITHLALSAVPSQCVKKDLVDYFENKYGKILDIWLDDESRKSWIIEFDDYDSVDRVLLDQTHVIQNSVILVEKGRPFYPGRKSSTATNSMSRDEIELSKSLRIHITNLPSTITASDLSSKLDCRVHDILMKPSMDDSPGQTECWLLEFEDDATSDQFIAQWTNQIIGGLRIRCKKEYDPLELCKFYQTGRCKNSDENCFWKHVPCSSERPCSSQCPFGHHRGSRKIWPESMNDNRHYRVKITGLPRRTTAYSMGRLFHKEEKYCLWDPKNEKVGYVQLVSIKMAQLFMSKWHGLQVDGGTLQCQLEIEPSIMKERCQSLSALNQDDDSEAVQDESHPSTKYHQSEIRSAVDFTDTPTKRADDGLLSNVFNDDEIGREERILGRAIGKTRVESASFSNRLTKPTTETSANMIPRELFEQWTTDPNEIRISTRSLCYLSGCRDRKATAVLKRYSTSNNSRFIRESTALTTLKDECCVPKLLQSSDANSTESWIVMNRIVGSTLRSEVNRLGPHRIDLRQSIEIVQRVIKILQTLHEEQVFHQNLSPDHIIIDRNPALNPSFQQAPITLISFSQAQTKQDEANNTDDADQSKFWYNARQKTDHRYRATIDATGVCAILLWLMTAIEPSGNDSNLFHEQKDAREKIESISKAAIGYQNGQDKIHRLQMYLISTFDRAFGYPDYSPWTLSDLTVRLESIYEFVSVSSRRSENPSCATLFDKILDVDRQGAIRSAAERGSDRGMILQRAAEVIDQAKQAFINDEPNHFHWSVDRCEWVDISNGLFDQCRSDDILTFSKLVPNGIRSLPIIISFIIKISDDDQKVSILIATCVNRKEIQIPIVYRENQKNFGDNFDKKFINELNVFINIFSKEYQMESN